MRGSQTIDYILASPDLHQCISQSGVMSPSQIISSDHKAVFVDITTSHLLGKPLSNLMNPSQRRLYSTNTCRRETYVNHLYNSVLRHNILQRSFKLLNVTDRQRANSLAEAIDRDMTHLMLAAEKQLPRHSPFSYSSQLSSACLPVWILKLHIRGKQIQASDLADKFNTS